MSRAAEDLNSTIKSKSLRSGSKSVPRAAEPNTSSRVTPKRRHNSASSSRLDASSGCMAAQYHELPILQRHFRAGDVCFVNFQHGLEIGMHRVVADFRQHLANLPHHPALPAIDECQ